MHIRKLLFPLLAIGAALGLILRVFARSGRAEPAARAMPYAALEAYLEKEIRRLKMPGASLAIVEGHRIAHFRGFGQARPDSGAPTLQTPFFIGSLAKSITALAVMQLVEAGKIELDAPIQRYLPWFRVAEPQASAQITVRHLLNQTSGLPVWTGDAPLADADPSPGAAERQARTLATVELVHPPGAVCEYNNMNYNLLGLVIEATSGKRYADYIQEQIFDPLEMRHSYTSKIVAQEDGLAMGHRYWFASPVATPNLPIPHGSIASGQLIASAEDMAHYLIAHLNDGRYENAQVLSAAGIDQLQRGALEYSRFGISAGRYAMGWFDGQLGQKRVVWHSGTNPDFGSYMAILPEQKRGILLLFNGCHYWFNPVLTEMCMGAAALFAGEQYTPPSPARFFPWILRGQLLIPLVQILNVAATVRLLHDWRLRPERRPGDWRGWGKPLLLPLVPNLLVALMLKPMLGKTGGYLRLFMPDSSWIALICGSFGLLWSILRTGLILRALRAMKET